MRVVLGETERVASPSRGEGAVRIVDLVHEEHFSEGEPDLEPPEELAVEELDDETVLEEELDNDQIDEEDVDDDVLTVTLEDLVHADDGEDGEVEVEALVAFDPLAASGMDEAIEELEELDVAELEDLEESLDRLLVLRLALETEGDETVEPAELAELGGPGSAPPGGLVGCRPDEFVCRGCFLVRHRTQLADTAAWLCRDCSG